MKTFLLALATAGIALSSASAGGCVPSTSEPIAEAGDLYVAGEPRSLLCDPTCFLDLWVYEESNGIAGLQRADEVVDDTCRGAIPGDTILF